MASVFKQKDTGKYVIVYRDETGRRRKKIGTKDRAVTERIARHLENKVAMRKDGVLDPKDEAYAAYAAQPLNVHLQAWKASTKAKGATPKHVKLFTTRAARVIALVKGAELTEIDPPRQAKHAELPKFEAALEARVKSAWLADLTADRVQKALAKLRDEGRSLATVNHHRAAIKAFSTWCHENCRMREDELRGVTGYNAKKDPRHERRAISIEELQRLVAVAQAGPTVLGLTGPERAMAYRLAVATGLRYGAEPGKPLRELACITPESFDWQSSTVSVRAAYTKNGEPAEIKIPAELMSDLAEFVAKKAPKEPVFPFRRGKGAKMIRADLAVAKIPYRDAGGLMFDFHALRGMLATLNDLAGVPHSVNQKRMRHSSPMLTAKYIRPRLADIDAAAEKLPSLKPATGQQEALAATGTDDKMVGAIGTVTYPVTDEDGSDRNILSLNDIGQDSGGLIIRRSGVRVASPVILMNIRSTHDEKARKCLLKLCDPGIGDVRASDVQYREFGQPR